MRGNIPALGIVLALTFAGPHARAEQRLMIDAKEGSVGIGGNVTDSTITIGIPAEKIEELIRSRTKDLADLAESQRETITQLKETLSLTQGQVSHALKILGETNIRPEQLATKLGEIAEKFKDLQQAATAQPGDDAKITALKAEAQQAIQDGQLGKADEILAAIEKAQTEAIDRLALNAAQTAAQRGNVALASFRYVDAAQHFAKAAAKVPRNKDERVKYLSAEASALLKQGFEFGADAAALSAIARYRALVELLPRNASPLDWARAQNGLGFALLRLGERESGTARLEEAVVVLREALQEATRERAPLLWAMTQKNLGLAFIALGGREGGTARLKEAVAVLQEALQEGTRARAPLERAFILNNLGGALVTLGQLENGTARLEEAVVVHQEALQEATRARARPLLLAMTKVGLGQALQAIGERETGTARLEQAVAAYQEALQDPACVRAPRLWANTQMLLGRALHAIGERESGTARLSRGVTGSRDPQKAIRYLGSRNHAADDVIE
ncbi:tetratricopeptide repeat protein [Bradyrhizobium sp. SRL28]|uniref:tetratricopeptide repeat protein n=1 Tax=Bradyrhizobium sp. SRL28 TaxID=2836178 RepID=UPI001BDF4EE2|nr:tetratricopeptide repeat protein [Bradyrhizobium sp. SRL28]MBT1509614.1 tetratricopeptide repeat protein [Bradyrhizobium sp. SRL28]